MPTLRIQVTIRKIHVIAYFEGEELEIIVVPMKDGDLTDVRVVEESFGQKYAHNP